MIIMAQVKESKYMPLHLCQLHEMCNKIYYYQIYYYKLLIIKEMSKKFSHSVSLLVNLPKTLILNIRCLPQLIWIVVYYLIQNRKKKITIIIKIIELVSKTRNIYTYSS